MNGDVLKKLIKLKDEVGFRLTESSFLHDLICILVEQGTSALSERPDDGSKKQALICLCDLNDALNERPEKRFSASYVQSHIINAIKYLKSDNSEEKSAKSPEQVGNCPKHYKDGW